MQRLNFPDWILFLRFDASLHNRLFALQAISEAWLEFAHSDGIKPTIEAVLVWAEAREAPEHLMDWIDDEEDCRLAA